MDDKETKKKLEKDKDFVTKILEVVDGLDPRLIICTIM